MFSIDTESGFDQVVFITAAYGLGETVVQGAVNPDEFYVYKPNVLAGRPAVLSKTLGAKAIKMVYTGAAAAGRSVETVRRGRELTGSAFRSATRRPKNSRATRSPSNAITSGRWISSGGATGTTASSTSCRRGRRR